METHGFVETDGGSRGGKGVVEMETGRMCFVVSIEDSLELLTAS